jgi:hypothetical protein
MTGQDILELTLEATGKSQANFLDGTTATAYKRLNTAFGHRILDILRVRVDKNASMALSTTDLISTVGLVAGDNGFNGEYSFPSDLLNPVRVEVSYDGVTWLKAQIYDDAINLGSEFNDAQIQNQFSPQFPAVNFERNSYKIRPLKTTVGDITAGIKITYEQRQTNFTSSTAPDIEPNLQDLLAYDLAEYDIVAHADSYSPTQIAVIRGKRAEIERKFLSHYQSTLGNTKVMTLKFKSYK